MLAQATSLKECNGLGIVANTDQTVSECSFLLRDGLQVPAMRHCQPLIEPIRAENWSMVQLVVSPKHALTCTTIPRA
eukprot:1876673-Amphidinium_carterae.1